MPDPSPRALRIWTTDGVAAVTTSANPSPGPPDADATVAVGCAPSSVSATIARTIAATDSSARTAPAPDRRRGEVSSNSTVDLRGGGQAARRACLHRRNVRSRGAPRTRKWRSGERGRFSEAGERAPAVGGPAGRRPPLPAGRDAALVP